MLSINLKTNYLEENKNFFCKLNEKDSFDWQCSNCGKIHHETEYRNFIRRTFKCVCQSNEIRFNEINQELEKNNYSFLHKQPFAYQVSKNGKIECKKPILVKCLKCGKISYEYYNNIRKGHKKCNCNSKKKFTRGLTIQEFYNKWPDLNKQNFNLLSTEYLGRNEKYRIKCKKCGKEDERWGITLIDGEISCKYCDYGSKNEQLIAMLLDKRKIEYIREYLDEYNGHLHRFDFFLPDFDIIIEYNGKQHYESIEHFGGQKQFELRQQRDLEKQKYCEQEKIKLIIFDYQQSSKDIETKIGLIFNDYPEKE